MASTASGNKVIRLLIDLFNVNYQHGASSAVGRTGALER